MDDARDRSRARGNKPVLMVARHQRGDAAGVVGVVVGDQDRAEHEAVPAQGFPTRSRRPDRPPRYGGRTG